MFQDFEGLEHTLRAYRQRIGRILENVSVDEILEPVFVVSLHCIDVRMRSGAELQGTLFYFLLFLFRESAGVHHDGVDLQSLFILQIRHAERSVKTSAECEYDFVVHIITVLMFFFIFRTFGAMFPASPQCYCAALIPASCTAMCSLGSYSRPVHRHIL